MAGVAIDALLAGAGALAIFCLLLETRSKFFRLGNFYSFALLYAIYIYIPFKS